MSISPAQTLPASPALPGASGNLRPQEQTFPPSENGSIEAFQQTQSAAQSADALGQDEVKLQWDATDKIPVYQFVNRQGTLILQVPSQQLLNIVQGISDELAQESASRSATAGEGEKK